MDERGYTLADLIHGAITKLQDVQTTVADSLEDMQLIDAYLDGAQKKYSNAFSLAYSRPTRMIRAIPNLPNEVNELPPKFSDGSFRQKGNKLEYRFMHDGEQLSVYAASETECFALRTKIIAGELPAHHNKKKILNRNETFAEWITEWFQLYKIPKLDKDTVPGMLSYINNDILPAFKKVTLKKVDALQLQKFLTSFNNTPNKRYKISLILNGALKKALILKKIKDNPFLGVEIDSPDSNSYKAFTYEQQELIYNKIDDELLKETYYILCCTGLRIGEFLALTKDDVNFADKYLYIHQTRQKQSLEVKPRTKTRRNRYVPFTEELISHFKNYFNLTANKKLAYDTVRKHFRKILNDNGLADKDYTIHSCRHTFGSVAYQLRISEKQIQAWLGHTTLDMTLNIYTELLPSGDSFVKRYLAHLDQELNLIP